MASQCPVRGFSGRICRLYLGYRATAIVFGQVQTDFTCAAHSAPRPLLHGAGIQLAWPAFVPI